MSRVSRCFLTMGVLLAAAVVVSPAAYALPPCYLGFGTVTSPQYGQSGLAYSYQVPEVVSDIEPCELSFSFTLTTAPAGMSITDDGLIQWTTPTPGTSSVTVQLVVDYTQPSVRTVTTSKTFSLQIVNCSAGVDLKVGAKFQGLYSGGNPTYISGSAWVTNPSPVCDVSGVSGTVDFFLYGYYSNLPHRVQTYTNIPVPHGQTVAIWSDPHFIAYSTDFGSMWYAMTNPPAGQNPWLKNTITGATVPDPIPGNNQCQVLFYPLLFNPPGNQVFFQCSPQ